MNPLLEKILAVLLFVPCFLLIMMVVDPLVGMKMVELIDWLDKRRQEKEARAKEPRPPS